MHHFWDTVIQPILLAVRPKDIVEIGCAAGNNTRNLLSFSLQHGGIVHAIDPKPAFDPATWRAEHGDRFCFYQALSLNALPLVQRFDTILVDGDHNWYTVYHELKLVERLCEQRSIPYPVVLLHDVGWPYGRRDMYYDPSTIPDAYRQPYRKLGMVPDSPELQPSGGLNPDLNNSIYENNLRNGVLTAVEDFLRETRLAFDFVVVPGFYGLGVLVTKELLDCNQDLRAVVDALRLSPVATDLLTSLERARLQQAVALSNTTSQLRMQMSEIANLREQVGQLQAQLAESNAALIEKDSAVTTLQTQVHELASASADREATILDLQGRVEKLAARLRGYDQRATESVDSTASEMIEELQKQLTNANEALAIQTAEARELRDRANKLEIQLKKAQGESSAVAKRLNDMICAHQKDVEQLSRWIEALDKVVSALVASTRWKVGNAVVTTISKLLFKPSPGLATGHRDQIMRRFQNWKSSSVNARLPVPETREEYPSITERETAHRSIGTTGFPRVSVVSAVLNKSESLYEFVAAFHSQTYPGEIEMILVDDGSTDQSIELIGVLKQTFEQSGKLLVKLVRNHKNLGNTGSRNVGIAHATGDILIVLDADCIVNELFVAEHVAAHQKGFDVCIGPMGIESKGRPIPSLHRALMSDPQLLSAEMRLQYPQIPNAFVNCVTRNFSISRAFLDQLGEPLFDERFAYSKDPDSGFGWEDVEMGYRLYLAGASIWFAPNAISVHKTHDPEVPDSEKAPRSAKNFARLLAKHPELVYVLPQWVVGTFSKIKAWVEKYGLRDNPDVAQVSALLAKAFATDQEVR